MVSDILKFWEDRVIIQEDTYKIVSYQSKEVLETILNEEIYYSDLSKSREKRDYSVDIKQLGGYNPIWGFLIPTFKELEIYYGIGLIDTHRCEMSTSYENMEKRVILELNIPKHLVKHGKTHNSYDYAVVFPFITKEFLSNVYELKEVESSGFSYSYYLIEISKTLELNNKFKPLFENKFKTLTGNEFDEFEHVLSKDLPLKYIDVPREYEEGTSSNIFISKEI